MPGTDLRLKLCDKSSIPQHALSIQQLRNNQQNPYAVLHHAHYVRKWTKEEAERKNHEGTESNDKARVNGVMPFEDFSGFWS